jgi:radical SAM protein with 4Fe4S-binding SPASM domain
MFPSNSVPYFPLKLKAEGGIWLLHNPLTDTIYKLNGEASMLLRLCDGYRTFAEITEELAQSYHHNEAELIDLSLPVLQMLTDEGILWWRRARMHCWRLPPPTAVLWDLTGRCNLRCRHCVVDSQPSRVNELSFAECERLIDQMAGFGVQQLILSGGEPMLRTDFLKICQYAAGHGLSLQVATNATLVSEHIAEVLAHLGASAQVSLDSSSSEVHDDFRQCAGAWERGLRGIRLLLAAGVAVTLAATVTKSTIDGIPALYRMASELGVHTFRILPFVPYGRGKHAQQLEVSPAQMQQLTAFLRQEREEVGLPVAPMEFECTFAPPSPASHDPSAHVGCDGAIGYCTVNAEGEVLPCNFFCGVQAENVREHDFTWIWHNSRFLNYFRSLTIDDIHGACRSCAWLAACRGSCLAANFAHGDIFQSNCHCWLATGAVASSFSGR